MNITREEAMSWWNSLPIIEKSLIAQKYSNYLNGRGYVSLTGREIENLYTLMIREKKSYIEMIKYNQNKNI